MPDECGELGGMWPDPLREEVVVEAAERHLLGDPAHISEQDLRQSYRRLLLLYDLGRQICAETDEKRVFGTILSAVSELLNVERAFIAVLADGQLVARAAHGLELGKSVSEWPVSSTMLQRVLNEGVSLLTADALHDASYGKARSVDLHNIRSVMCCPLRGPGALKGLIYVDNRIKTGAFSRADLAFLGALSHYAFLAIKNAEEREAIAADRNLAEARLEALRREMPAVCDLVGTSKQIVQLYGQAKKVAAKDVPVLIVGETGTGKEVLARLIHSLGPRSAGPFIAVNVVALSPTLIESDLFGHEKGAFTGADRRRIGRFELAQGGTLLLDEVQDIPLELQPKLLRVLEQRTFERLGDNEVRHTDARIICACNRDLADCVSQGRFRQDLFYRLNAVVIEVPPLRERREDVVPLAHHFLARCGSKKVFDQEAMDCLVSFSWPGNVRELMLTVAAVDAMADGQVVHASDLPKRMQPTAGTPPRPGQFEPLPAVIARIEREHMVRAIELAGGNYEQAIRLLGISRSTFFQRKKEYGLSD